jgi:alpha-tubulin suppressor-like RCC1 family protein
LIDTTAVFVALFLVAQPARANPLAEALGQPGLTVASSGDAPWLRDETISYDGIDSAGSGMIGDSGASIIEATVAGPGEVAFRWRVSSQAGADILSFAINGVADGPQLSGESGWQSHSATLGPGSHTLRWTYAKDASTSAGSDRAWVDDLAVPPQAQPAIAVQPEPATTVSGGHAVLKVSASGGSLEYQWFRGQSGDTSQPVAGATGRLLVTPALRETASFWVRATNPLGTADSTAALVTVTQPEPCRLLATGANSNGQLGNGTTTSRNTWGFVAADVASVAAGSSHSLFIATGGTLRGMGSNTWGQLGDGTSTARSTPVAITTGASTVACGTSHSLILKSDGTLWANGINSSGQLGDGSNTSRNAPVPIATEVIAIAAGGNHSLFIKQDGSLWATGANSSGQLGDGTTTNRATPLKVAEGVVRIAAGDSHSLFVKADGSLWAMGNNGSGRLGDGTTTNRPVPVRIASSVMEVAAGNSHSLFVTANGILHAMGSNSSGRLGDGTTTARSRPVVIAASVARIAAGNSHSLFITQDRTLWAAGDNGFGQLGDGTSTNRLTPVSVASQVADIAANGSHSLIRTLLPTIVNEPADTDNPAGGTAALTVEATGPGPLEYQWFIGTSGDLSSPLSGANSATLTTPPASADASFWVRVSNPYTSVNSRTVSVLMVATPIVVKNPDPLAVSPGTAVVMTVTAEGRALTYQWYRGLSGDTSIPVNGATGPLLVATPHQATQNFWVRIANSAGHADSLSASATPAPPLNARLLACGLNSSGQLGDDSKANRSSFVPVAPGVAAAAAGGSHSLILKSDGSLWATGSNSNGQLGDGTNISRFAPVQIATAVASAAAGSSHSLFVGIDGNLWAMGYNTWNQLGDGTNISRSSPVLIATGVGAVAAGADHSLFLKTDGTLWAMGLNSSGSLGDGTTTRRARPVMVTDSVVAIAAGDSHSLFLRTDGTLLGMGSNSSGQLGDGTTTNRLTPIVIAEGVAIAAAGDYHSLFVKTDGSLWAMGSNSSGRLGDGTTTNRTSPVLVANGVIAAAAGGSHSMFVKTDGTRWAMGSNDYGKLGDVSTANNRSSPVQVGTATAVIAAGGNHSLALDLIPAITAQPVDSGAPPGGNVSLSVAATGSGPLSYQWFTGATGDTSQPVSGAASQTLTLTGLSAPSQRWVRVSNPYGHADSRSASVLVLTTPAITTAPAPTTVIAGGNAVFTVAAGGGLLEFQWFRGAAGDTSSPVTGATSSTLVTPPVGSTATYWVRVSNAVGSADSPAAAASPAPPIATRVLACGFNSSGQLGDGTTIGRLTPIVVAADAIAAAAGGNHSLILRSDKTLFAVGSNTSGQLGDGTILSRSIPVPVATDVTSISAGESHSLFIRADGALHAMGNNTHGQLGDGSTTNRLIPVGIASGVAAAAAGGSHSLFVTEDGALWAMGLNSDGQLGDGTFENRSTPVQIATEVAAVAAGSSFSVFLKVDGSAWTMGFNDYGQIGDGTLVRRATPVRVADGVARIAAGNHHVLMVKSNGTLWTHGLNTNGQLGTGNINSQLIPTQVATGVSEVAAGSHHSAFITTGGDLRTMGGNNSGQLGDGTTSQRNTPVTVGQAAVSAAVGGSHTLFRDLKPAFRLQPADLNTAAGATPTLTVAASGEGPFSYQWYRGTSGDISQPVNGATSAAFTIPPLTETSSWWVRVSSARGTADSRGAQVLLVTPPVITTHPPATTVETGTAAALRAAASGDALQWQWFRGESGDTSQPVPGANGPMLVTPPLDAAESFWARVSNGAGHSHTTTAIVSITSPLPARMRLSGANFYGQLGDGSTTNRTTPWIFGANITRMAAGDRHSLFVKSDGSLWAMGYNNSGAVGDGTTTNRLAPVPIATDVRAIAAGENHSLFLKNDHSLWVMGSNSYGQLGDGTTTFRPTPIQVAGDVRLVAAGFRHSLFVKTDGTLWAMGGNSDGQLGDGSTTQRNTPVQIASDVATIAAGHYHSLFVKTDGSLWAAGSNWSGRLGNGNTINQSTPVRIADGVVAVSAGASHSLFLSADGTLRAAGYNDSGQLGDGTSTNRLAPVLVATSVTAIAAGGSHSFALKDDRTLWATGLNNYGQYGNGTNTSQNSFQQVATAVVSVAAGTSHSLTRDLVPVIAAGPADTSAPSGGTPSLTVLAEGVGPFTYQWFPGESGDTSAPQSDANTATFTIPPLVDTRRYWVRVSNAHGHADSAAATVTLVFPPQIAAQSGPATITGDTGVMLEVSATGGVLSYHWFRGNPGDTSQPVPFASGPRLVTPPLFADATFWVRVSNAAGIIDSAIFQLTHSSGESGRLLTSGLNSNGQLGDGTTANRTTPVFIAGGVRSIAAGGSHSLLVKTDGSLWACGSNSSGQIGDGVGASFHRTRPVWVADGVALAAAGSSHSLFVKQDGSLWAAGSNNLGQLGDGTTTNRNSPVPVADDVLLSSAGESHSLFLKNDGTLWAMGNNNSGQLGDGTTTSRNLPVQVAADVMAIAAGGSHSLFVKTDGSLWATGNNSSGRLGDGTTTSRSTPVRVADRVVRVAAGQSHSLFVKADGSLWAMGSNSSGRLGDGTTTSRSTPVRITENVVSASAGESHSQFIKNDGTLWAMGANNSGTLGDGTTSSRNSPVQIASKVLGAAAGGSHSLFCDALPVIEFQPQDAGVASGNSAALSIAASGPGTLTIQWYAGQSGDISSPVAGATAMDFETPMITADADFWVRVTNTSGSAVSRSANVKVVTLPVITSLTKLSAEGVLSVAATGGMLSYQWFEGTPGDVSTPISGATGPVLVSRPLNKPTAFWVRVTNAAGQADSETAELTEQSSLSARLLATGANGSGQFGDSTNLSRSVPLPIASRVAAMAAGTNHTLFVTDDGVLRGMGRNFSGQLGIGSSGGNRFFPALIDTNVSAVAAGDAHSLFLKTDGSLWAMGNNSSGHLGDGTTTNRSTPVLIAANVASIAAGSYYSLFVRDDGSLWAMGSNFYGQLGDGTTTSRLAAVEVAQDVASVAAGANHSLFLKNDGTLWAMGSNSNGQLGDGSATDQAVPVQVATGVARIAAGSSHSLFVKTDGSLWAMGGNGSSRLGDGTTVNRDRPVPIADGAVLIAAGFSHSLFVKANGTLWAMGYNSSGQLGDGTTSDRSTPVQVATSVAGISANGDFSLMLDLRPTIRTEPADIGIASGDPANLTSEADGPGPFSWQWYEGPAGDTSSPVTGATSAAFTTPPVTGPKTYWARVTNDHGTADTRAANVAPVTQPVILSEPASLSVTSGGNAALTVSASGGMVSYQWYQGQTGDVSKPIPGARSNVLVTPPLAAATHFWVRVTNAAGSTDSAAAAVSVSPPVPANLRVSGSTASGQLGTGAMGAWIHPAPVASEVAEVALGTSHVLILKTDGTLWAAGANQNGQLGDGTTTARTQPVAITSGVASIAASSHRSLFVKTDGTLWLMGASYGPNPTQILTGVTRAWLSSTHLYHLDAGNTLRQRTPGAPSSAILATGVASFSAGSSHNLFVKTDGTLWGFGNNSNGQIGGGSPSVSNPIKLADDVAIASAGDKHSLFLKTDGNLWGMGSNEFGQLAILFATSLTPQVWLAADVADVAAGFSHSLFIKADGSLWTFGRNADGELADGTTAIRHLPQRVANQAERAFGGNASTWFITTDGTLWAAGSGVPLSPFPPSFQSPGHVAGGVIRVSAGGSHSLRVDADGRLLAAGNNANGQLGDGSRTPRPAWIEIATEVSTAAAGLNHSLYLTNDGTLRAMGMNRYGQLGDGSTIERLTPVDVATGVVAAAAGTDHSLFLKDDHTLWAMGLNSSGQLGDGSSTNRSAPSPVAEGVAAFAAGANHSLFVKRDGSLWAAGSNSSGQLGTGDTTHRFVPAHVAVGVIAVAAGTSHSHFLKADGTLWSMGSNSSGQLGDGTTTSRNSPVQVASGVSAIQAGGAHSQFLKTDGSLWAMGSNGNGRLGDGTTTNRSTPVEVDAAVFAASAGGSHSLWLTANTGTPVTTIAGHPQSAWIKPGATAGLGVEARGETLSYQWYRGMSGEMETPLDGATAATFTTAEEGTFWVRATGANGITNSRAARVTFIDPPEITSQAALVARRPGGGVTLAAIASEAWSYQWYAGPAGDESQPLAGANDATLLTRPLRSSASYWVRAFNPAGQADSQAVTVDAPPPEGRFLFAAGQRHGGSNPVLLSGAVTSAATGANHGLFVTTDGTLWAVGLNTYGQLGTGNTLTAASPVRVTHDVLAAAAGTDHSLFIRGDGSLWAMGRNTNGQLGTGTGADAPSPRWVADDVTAVSAGSSHSLFIKIDNSLWAMGSNSSGRLGDGSTTDRHLPVKIADDVALIAAGGSHSLFVTTGGSLWVMGLNSSGQLGTVDNSAQWLPVRVTDGVAAIAAGSSHSLFVRNDGSLWGMGRNGDSELVIGASTSTISRNVFPSFNLPLLIAADVSTAAAGSNHSLFVKHDGTMWASGRNSSRQLTVQTSLNTPLPVEAHPHVHAVSAAGNNSFYLATTGTGDPPAILDHPQSVFIDPGGSTILTVSATGSGPLTYQWFAGMPGDTSSPVSGGASPTLFIMPTAPAGEYWVRVSNAAAYADSRAAAVIAAPTSENYRSWAAAQGLNGMALDPAADPDRDGRPNVLEFALGTAALTADAATRQVVPLPAPGGAEITLRLRASAGLILALQYGSTLADWQHAGLEFAEGTWTLADPLLEIIDAQPAPGDLWDLKLRHSSAGPRFFVRVAAGMTAAGQPGTAAYQQWALAAGLTGARLAPNADPDGDGLDNLTEFALGTHPRQSTNAAQRPAGSLVLENDQSYLALTHRRRKQDPPSTTYQWSADFLTWHDFTPAITLLDPDIDGDGRTELVGATLPQDAHQPRLFLRIRHTLP